MEFTASATIPSPKPSTAASSSASLISSPCAGCKFLRRKCQPDCVFAPYFPPDQPQKFAYVHRVFGASNVTKLLNDLQPYQREDAVNSLAYEAEMRLHDPVYGCVGVISLLQHQLRQLQMDLSSARSELSKYRPNSGSSHGTANVSNPVGLREMGLGRVAMEQKRHHGVMMMRNYGAEMGDAGPVAAVNLSSVSVGPFAGRIVKPSMAGGIERQGWGQS